mgnify:CR=1 FL=1
MKNLKADKGFALLITMILLIVLSLLGVAALNTSVQEVRISSNYQESILDLSWVEAGVEAARREIAISPDPEVSQWDCTSEEKTGKVGPVDNPKATFCVSLVRTVLDNSATSTGSGVDPSLRTKIFYYRIDSRVTRDGQVVKWAQSLEQIARLSL